jgi:sugar lactone lactonase YvrE
MRLSAIIAAAWLYGIGLVLAQGLYVADPGGEHVMAFDIQPDGSVRNQRQFARLEGVTRSDAGVTSGADCIAIDGAGRLYVSSRIGIQVFSAQGQHLGTIPVSRTIQNLAFAGPDKKTIGMLRITADSRGILDKNGVLVPECGRHRAMI